MPPRTCPHCNVVSNFETFGSSNWKARYGVGGNDHTAFAEQCQNCGMPVCGSTAYGGYSVWPEVIRLKVYKDVPKAIASTASEARQSIGAKAPRAAVAMARAAVETTAKDKGIATGNLQAKIDRLHADGHISEAMKEAAHEIRDADGTPRGHLRDSRPGETMYSEIVPTMTSCE
jgi:Domain of unknown function (DUF4145)